MKELYKIVQISGQATTYIKYHIPFRYKITYIKYHIIQLHERLEIAASIQLHPWLSFKHVNESGYVVATNYATYVNYYIIQ